MEKDFEVCPFSDILMLLSIRKAMGPVPWAGRGRDPDVAHSGTTSRPPSTFTTVNEMVIFTREVHQGETFGFHFLTTF